MVARVSNREIYHAILQLECLEQRTLLATCNVLNLNDSGSDSLRACLEVSPKPDKILFDSFLTGTIPLSTALPTISWDVEITGPPLSFPDQLPVVNVQRLNTAGSFRIFTIQSPVPEQFGPPTGFVAEVTISNLTISNGQAQFGGGIYNEEKLTLTNCIVTGNVATTSDAQIHRFGGGIYSGTAAAILKVNDSRIENNRIEGAIGNSAGVLYWGAGIFVGFQSTLEVQRSVISANSTCNPTTACAIPTSSPTASWAVGGGIYNDRGTILIVDSSIDGNSVRMPDVGNAQFRAEGAAIGGECRPDTCVEIFSSTISGNFARVSGTAENSSDQSRSLGGAISLAGVAPTDQIPGTTEVLIVNTTIEGNRNESEVVGITQNTLCDPEPKTLSTACRVGAGAIWTKWLFMVLKYCTITNNTSENLIPQLDNAEGGAIHLSSQFQDDSRLRLRSTIVATNLADGQINSIFSGDRSFASLGHNMFDDAPQGNSIDDFINVADVKLDLLGSYGGLTMTRRPFNNSPTVGNGGPRDTDVLTDQRGLPRPETTPGETDIGAVECQLINDCMDPPGPGGITAPPTLGSQSWGVDGSRTSTPAAMRAVATKQPNDEHKGSPDDPFTGIDWTAPPLPHARGADWLGVAELAAHDALFAIGIV